MVVILIRIRLASIDALIKNIYWPFPKIENRDNITVFYFTMRLCMTSFFPDLLLSSIRTEESKAATRRERERAHERRQKTDHAERFLENNLRLQKINKGNKDI